MMEMVWNLPTVIVFAVVCALVALCIWKLVRDRKSGHPSCGGNCSGCSMAQHEARFGQSKGGNHQCGCH
ncbi:MAG: FeoB-associated Cys-rich membrane protein [Eubacteriales bacterium]|nr:FeoB-associated Cys-rich membrane protein [Eubacteriales bacterium]